MVSVWLGLDSSLSASVSSRPGLATPPPPLVQGRRGVLTQEVGHWLSLLDRGTLSIVLTWGEQGSPTLDSLAPGRELHAMLKARWDLGTSVGCCPGPGLPGQLRGMPQGKCRWPALETQTSEHIRQFPEGCLISKSKVGLVCLCFLEKSLGYKEEMTTFKHSVITCSVPGQ